MSLFLTYFECNSNCVDDNNKNIKKTPANQIVSLSTVLDKRSKKKEIHRHDDNDDDAGGGVAVGGGGDDGRGGCDDDDDAGGDGGCGGCVQWMNE